MFGSKSCLFFFTHEAVVECPEALFQFSAEFLQVPLSGLSSRPPLGISALLLQKLC